MVSWSIWMKSREKRHQKHTVHTHPITAPMSCPTIITEFDPNDLINCNSSSHILYGVYSLRHCGLSESLKPFKSSATTRKNRDNSLICKWKTKKNYEYNAFERRNNKWNIIVISNYFLFLSVWKTKFWPIINLFNLKIVCVPDCAIPANNPENHEVVKPMDHIDRRLQYNVIWCPWV